MQNIEKDFETIYNELQELLVDADDDYKLQVYDELLQTGSVTVFGDEDKAHYFSFREFRHELFDETEIGIDLKRENGDK